MIRILRRVPLLVLMMLYVTGAASCGGKMESSSALPQEETVCTTEQTTAARSEEASHSDSLYLSANQYAVEPNMHTEVTFYAHAETAAAEQVILYCEGAALGEMHRDSASDYSLTLDLFSDTEKEQGYYAAAGGEKSDVFYVSFRHTVIPDASDEKTEDEIAESVRGAVQAYTTPEGLIKADCYEKAEKAVCGVLDTYKSQSLIKSYSFSGRNVVVTFPSGYTMHIMLRTEGIN